METLRYCTEMLGSTISQRTGLFTWDTMDGNVILQTTFAALRGKRARPVPTAPSPRHHLAV
jgi:hypothetical protein